MKQKGAVLALFLLLSLVFIAAGIYAQSGQTMSAWSYYRVMSNGERIGTFMTDHQTWIFNPDFSYVPPLEWKYTGTVGYDGTLWSENGEDYGWLGASSIETPSGGILWLYSPW